MSVLMTAVDSHGSQGRRGAAAAQPAWRLGLGPGAKIEQNSSITPLAVSPTGKRKQVQQQTSALSISRDRSASPVGVFEGESDDSSTSPVD